MPPGKAASPPAKPKATAKKPAKPAPKATAKKPTKAPRKATAKRSAKSPPKAPKRSPFGALRQAFEEAWKKSDLLPCIDGYSVLLPGQEGYPYHCTPVGSEIFASLGVDGLHLAALAVDGAVGDASPVVQVCPMDSVNNRIIAASLGDFLAAGCNTTEDDIRQRWQDGAALAAFVAKNFKLTRLTKKARTEKLWRQHGALVVLPP